MDFIDQIRQFSAKIQEIKDQVQTEEATKHSLILPFIQMLGYNVFDPGEVIPEFTADVGVKKGERVDYAIFVNGKPSILIEAKPIDDPLINHSSQLYRYFSVTEAKFAILTNGITYKFYSDIQEPNKMDDSPFLEFNLFDVKESTVAELKKFKKEAYNTDELFSAAITLKYTNKIKALFDQEIKEPSEELIRFFLKEIYSGKVTQNVIEKFKPIVKRALGQYINEVISEKIKTAIETSIQTEEAAPAIEATPEVEKEKSILTTTLELEAFFLIKSICRDAVDTKRITYKDTLSYFNVLFDNNTWKWVCRLYLNGTKKYMILPTDEKETKLSINQVDDIFNYRDDILNVLNKYLESK
ncbi:hypothetical protein EDC14_1004123 [Hydrogenispora ethanolica]|uniref:Restriction endonuclease type I HsdR N-terminal domain-containing protein n=1 Tax=Hydrogenispora ethanolica TaxID=1082276 RepID=A0A4R1S4J0_HYDET|nr:type I restriction endonuclease [Hydrogenispora ethanolica]TCL74185.1 hypothetical protein EDC14_1004123 [Hydrogenispora ethanolica]